MKKTIYLVGCTSLLWACTSQEASNSNNTATGAHRIEIEAEEADIRPPFQVASDETTSGGHYIWVPNHATNLNFTVSQPGKYKVWGRVFCAFGGEDSFNMRLDEEKPFNWNNITHSDTWIWDDVHEKDEVKVFDLAAAQHTLAFRPREAGSKLDKLLITNDLNYTPEGNPEMNFKSAKDKEYIWMEAEAGDIHPPYAIEAHHTASGNQHISVPTESTRFKVDIPEAGNYRILAKVYAKAGNENSIKLRVGNTGGYKNWNAVPTDKFNQWIWEEVDLDNKTPEKTTFSLEEGPTSIWIRYREEGLKIDKILITDDMEFQPEEENTLEI